MNEPTYGKTKHGVPINDALVAKLAEQAEAGYDVDQVLKRRRGRPPLGAAAAAVGSVRLDPELRAAVQNRADSQSETVSSIVREALRLYLAVNAEPHGADRVDLSPMATRPAALELRLAYANGSWPRLQLQVGSPVRVPARAFQRQRPTTTAPVVFHSHPHLSNDPRIDQSRTRRAVDVSAGLTLGA
jgi:hypothetical protein